MSNKNADYLRRHVATVIRAECNTGRRAYEQPNGPPEWSPSLFVTGPHESLRAKGDYYVGQLTTKITVRMAR